MQWQEGQGVGVNRHSCRLQAFLDAAHYAQHIAQAVVAAPLTRREFNRSSEMTLCFRPGKLPGEFHPTQCPIGCVQVAIELDRLQGKAPRILIRRPGGLQLEIAFEYPVNCKSRIGQAKLRIQFNGTLEVFARRCDRVGRRKSVLISNSPQKLVVSLGIVGPATVDELLLEPSQLDLEFIDDGLRYILLDIE